MNILSIICCSNKILYFSYNNNNNNLNIYKKYDTINKTKSKQILMDVQTYKLKINL